ncbi:hypothetical protein ACVWY2_006517 [Bradyrhizobium sp. JR6.1]
MRLLGDSSLRMLAIGSEQRDFNAGEVLFKTGDTADAGYVVQRGTFRVEEGGAEIIAGPGALIGELALIVAMKRPSTATALERGSVIRVARSLFQRVLEMRSGRSPPPPRRTRAADEPAGQRYPDSGREVEHVIPRRPGQASIASANRYPTSLENALGRDDSETKPPSPP